MIFKSMYYCGILINNSLTSSRFMGNVVVLFLALNTSPILRTISTIRTIHRWVLLLPTEYYSNTKVFLFVIGLCCHKRPHLPYYSIHLATAALFWSEVFFSLAIMATSSGKVFYDLILGQVSGVFNVGVLLPLERESNGVICLI